MKRNTNVQKPNIIHVLDDGTRLDSIEGFVIPDGHPFYTVWRNIVLAKRKEEAEVDAERRK